MMHEVSGGRFASHRTHGPSYIRMGGRRAGWATHAFIEKYRAETGYGPFVGLCRGAAAKMCAAGVALGVIRHVCLSHGPLTGCLRGRVRPASSQHDPTSTTTTSRPPRRSTGARSPTTLLPNYRTTGRRPHEGDARDRDGDRRGRRETPKHLRHGSPTTRVRAWRKCARPPPGAAGVHTPILMPSPAAGN